MLVFRFDKYTDLNILFMHKEFSSYLGENVYILFKAELGDNCSSVRCGADQVCLVLTSGAVTCQLDPAGKVLPLTIIIHYNKF